MKRFFLILLVALASQAVIRAQVSLTPLFTDHMVLQQRCNVPVWGKAAPGTSVTVKPSWSVKSETVRSDAEGNWSVKILTPKASFKKHTLTISAGGSSVTLQDVLIGEVWFCAGQSNMQMPMESWRAVRINQEDINGSDRYPDLRVLQLSRATGMCERESFSADFGGWQPSSSRTVRNFSAIAWYFGRRLQETLKLPVGLIHSSWGGTIIEAWMSAGALKDFPENAEKLAEMKALSEDPDERQKTYWGEMMKLLREARERDEGISGHWELPDLDDGGWRDVTLPSKIQELWPGINGVYWFRKEIDIPTAWAGKEVTLSLGPVDDFDETYWNGVLVGRDSIWNIPRTYAVPAAQVKAGKAVIVIRNTDDHGDGGLYGAPEQLFVQGPDGQKIPLDNVWKVQLTVSFDKVPRNTAREANLPSALYNAMVHPVAPYRIAGAIWYQGESNADKALRYQDQMPAMIYDWRQVWGYDFPFYITQIAGFHPVLPDPAESAWAELREAQSLTALHMEQVEQACIIDLSEADDAHPVRKEEAADRLARLALAKQYGRSKLACNGPRLSGWEISDGAVTLCFSDIAKGLRVQTDGEYAEIRYGKPAMDFEIVKKAESGAPTGFEVAGPDGVWHWADARIVPLKKPSQTQLVIVSSPEVPNPVAVRYGWADSPVCNLFNSEGLPAWPFRTR